MHTAVFRSLTKTGRLIRDEGDFMGVCLETYDPDLSFLPKKGTQQWRKYYRVKTNVGDGKTVPVAIAGTVTMSLNPIDTTKNNLPSPGQWLAFGPTHDVIPYTSSEQLPFGICVNTTFTNRLAQVTVLLRRDAYEHARRFGSIFPKFKTKWTTLPEIHVGLGAFYSLAVYSGQHLGRWELINRSRTRFAILYNVVLRPLDRKYIVDALYFDDNTYKKGTVKLENMLWTKPTVPVKNEWVVQLDTKNTEKDAIVKNPQFDGTKIKANAGSVELEFDDGEIDWLGPDPAVPLWATVANYSEVTLNIDKAIERTGFNTNDIFVNINAWITGMSTLYKSLTVYVKMLPLSNPTTVTIVNLTNEYKIDVYVYDNNEYNFTAAPTTDITMDPQYSNLDEETRKKILDYINDYPLPTASGGGRV